MLAFLLEWYQWVMLAALVVLIIVYWFIRKKQMG
jgi:hypothetical protein